jgi:hypothetical protein
MRNISKSFSVATSISDKFGSWQSLERRALLGVEKLSQTEPSNARRSVCAANHAAAKISATISLSIS